jgi:putative endonuclease
VSATPRRPRRETATASSISTPKSISPARIKAREDGIRAERAAAEHLVAQGFVILDVNVRVGRYEIDLLASDGPVLVVVEVRARGPRALVRALDTIDARKRARLRLAGKWVWRDRFANDRRFDRLRFDCVAVTFDAAGAPRLEHVRAAF